MPLASFSDDILYVGHSLVGFDIPEFVEGFTEASGGTGKSDAQVIIGAPLKYNWQNGASAQGVNARTALASGDYEVLILTEAVPLDNHLQWSSSAEYAGNYAALAVNSNPGARVYVYETWHSLLSGTGQPVEWDNGDHIPWRERIEQDLPKWQSIVDGINTRIDGTGAAPAQLIPTGQAFAHLHDAIAGGRIPGVTSIWDFFQDDIHPNDLGAYFISLVQFATINELSYDDLAALPTTIEAAWWRIATISPDIANALKVITAETLTDFFGDTGPGVPDPDPEVIIEEPVNLAPVAQDDDATTDEGESVVINVLANDSDPEGDTLKLGAIGSAGHGTVTKVDGGLRYTPDAGFSGVDGFTYVVEDGNGGRSTAEVAVEVLAKPQVIPGALLVNGEELTVRSYRDATGRGQDEGQATVSADQTAVTLSQNAWKWLELDYEVTANTVIAFDFSTTKEGEILGIGFDTDTRISEQWFLQVYGSQAFGHNQGIDRYSGTGTQSYEIAVGQYFQGSFDRLVLSNDNDAWSGGAATYSNIRIWERGFQVNGTGYDLDAYGVGRNGSGLQDEGRATLSGGGSTVTLTNNAWKSVDFNYTVTQNTVLRLTLDVARLGELHAIGFDTDSIMDDSHAFTFAGTQRGWGEESTRALYDDGLGGAQQIEIRVGDYFTGDFSKLFFVGDDDANVGARTIFSNVEIFEAAPEIAQSDASKVQTEPAAKAVLVPDAAQETAEGVLNPSVAANLEFVRDYATSVPFIDIAKMMREPFALQAGTYEWNEVLNGRELQATGYLDDNGYPTQLPQGAKVSSIIMTEMPAEATSVSGRYRLTYEGEGKLELWGSARNIDLSTPGEIWFDYTAGTGPFGIHITATDPGKTGDYIRDISIVREDHIAMHEVGAVFNPTWLEHLEDLRMVRFMDWMNTNGSTQSEWADRPMPEDFVWTQGVPVEVMVALANRIGADPWFNIPHLATDEYIENFAAYVRDNLDPSLKAHVEYSNEMWNFSGAFGQTAWAQEQAAERWGSGVNWMEFVGMRAANVAQIWDRVFDEQADERVVNVIGVQTGWKGLEVPLLTSPHWVAENPAENLAPHEYFDAYAVTGYFGGDLAYEQANDVFTWIDQSRRAAEAEASNLGLQGNARSTYIEEHKFDLAVSRAVDAIHSSTLDQLVSDLWPYHRAVADSYGLDMIMYEGGTHVDPGPYRWNSPELLEFFEHLNYTPELAAVYDSLLEAWQEVGDGPFNAYTDIAKSGVWGGFGHLRHIDDDTARWQKLQDYNADVEAWFGDRDAGAFDQGLILVGADGADTLTGTVEDDILIGGGGNDLLVSGGGYDRIHGGAGVDTARLAGQRDEFVFNWDGDNLIADSETASIVLRDIERLTFSDEPGVSLSVIDL
ncbi:MAG: Ig-like domain-containing protein [Qingshengfaniella sp.]